MRRTVDKWEGFLFILRDYRERCHSWLPVVQKWPGEIDPEPEGFGAVTTTTI